MTQTRNATRSSNLVAEKPDTRGTKDVFAAVNAPDKELSTKARGQHRDARHSGRLCAMDTVKNGACTCARTHKLVKKGKNAWACVKVVVDRPRNKDKATAEVKTAPKKTAAPKSGNADKAKGGQGKGKIAKARQRVVRAPLAGALNRKQARLLSGGALLFDLLVD